MNNIELTLNIISIHLTSSPFAVNSDRNSFLVASSSLSFLAWMIWEVEFRKRVLCCQIRVPECCLPFLGLYPSTVVKSLAYVHCIHLQHLLQWNVMEGFGVVKRTSDLILVVIQITIRPRWRFALSKYLELMTGCWYLVAMESGQSVDIW